MNKTTALLTLGFLIHSWLLAMGGERAIRSAQVSGLSLVARIEAPAQVANAPRWSSRDEYDAYRAAESQEARSPDQAIFLAESFLLKFPNSGLTSGAYLIQMRSYYRLGRIPRAVTAGRHALRSDRGNLDALSFLNYVFPFTFSAGAADADAKLANAEAEARRGLAAIQNLQKSGRVTDGQFKIRVQSQRAACSRAMGFVALERGDDAGAIAALQAAAEDNPDDLYTFKWLGLASLNSTPPDYQRGVWYLSRAAVLARNSRSPAAQPITDYLHSLYSQQLGRDDGVENLIAQALTRVAPPEHLNHHPHLPIKPHTGSAAAQNASAHGSGNPSVNGQPSTPANAIQSACSSESSSPYCQQNSGRPPIAAATSWLPASSYQADDPVPLPPPADPDDEIAAQLSELSDDVDMLRQDLAAQQAQPANSEPPAPEAPPPVTVLIYKDGSEFEVQNYAIMGKTLMVLDALGRKIPLADLDLAATRKFNDNRGITFVVPDQR